MSKPIVVQTCWMPEAFIQKAAEAGKIELRLWKPQEGERRMTAPQEWIKEHIQGASALMCTPMNKVSEEIFEAAGPSLKVVSTMSVGFEHIDREAAKQRGIRVGYTPDVLSPAVADVGLLLALNVMRHVLDGMNTVKTGTWLKKTMVASELLWSRARRQDGGLYWFRQHCPGPRPEAPTIQAGQDCVPHVQAACL